MKTKIALLISLLALAPSAFALSFTELGDAGQTVATAQNTGSGTLDSISGNFTDGNDVDFFSIYLDGSAFSATVSSGTDPMLFLWDSSGNPLLFNDDYFGLQSFIGGTFSAGNYILGISQFANGYGLHQADSGWAGSSYGFATYTINLGGAQATGVPDGGSTLALLGLALGGIAWVRRSRK